MAYAPRELKTVDHVILALGKGDRLAGRQELLRLTGRKPQHVTNWYAFGSLPLWTYLIVKHAVGKRGHKLRPSVCGMPEPGDVPAKAS